MACRSTHISAILPEYLCIAIPHTNFNRMQVECMETWESDANMLISAPTGAGKTLCFELAILRVLHKALANSEKKQLGSNGLEEKMVYLAPTKSLCSERADDWKRKFGKLGLRVQSVTGDSSFTSLGAVFRNADLVVTTAEKWDSLTRNLTSRYPKESPARVVLFLLDEVHQVGDARGAVFEAVVTRMLAAHSDSSTPMPGGDRSSQASALRIVAVSATVGNIGDIGMWLRVSDSNVKVFDEAYRPVSLEYHIKGYTASNPWLYARTYDKHLLGVLTKYGEGRPCLVFCTSRKQTLSSAGTLVDKLTDKESITGKNVNSFLRCLSEDQKAHLFSCVEQCTHPLLRKTLPYGVGIHNADMSLRTRQLVEILFRKGLIGCLFSTSTLAQGVNLPARLVVIAGTTVYNEGLLQEYQQNLLLQMCGRAGRPGLDTRGTVVIMTSRSQAPKYQNLGNQSPGIIESKLASSLAERLNAEVARQAVTDLPSAVRYLSNTLFYAQLIQNSATSGSTLCVRGPNLGEIAQEALDELSELGLAVYDDDRFGLSCTTAGFLMARYCLSITTIRFILDKMPEATSAPQILRIVASCAELQESVYLRRSERKRLNEINEWIRIPVKGKVQGSIDKVIVLLQLVIGDQKECRLSDITLRSEGERLLQTAARVSGCLISLVLQRALDVRYGTTMAVLQVCRALQSKCLWDGPTVLRQIPGISISDMRALNRAGVSSLSKLSSLKAGTLKEQIGCRAAFTASIDTRMRFFPHFVVKTEVLQEEAKDGPVSYLSVRVDVKALRGTGRVPHRRGVSWFILIGHPFGNLIACDVFPLSDCQGVTKCFLPRVIDRRTDGQIDIVVGCANLCGTDVTMRVSNGTPQHESEPCGLSRKRLEPCQADDVPVTARRLTKKLSGNDWRQDVNASRAVVKSGEACQVTGKKTLQSSLLDSISYEKITPVLQIQGLQKRAKRNTSAIHPKTPVLVSDKTLGGPETTKRNPKSRGLRSMEKTPATSRSHPLGGSSLPTGCSGKEYDDVLRKLF